MLELLSRVGREENTGDLAPEDLDLSLCMASDKLLTVLILQLI
jgi:hypothetical protein